MTALRGALSLPSTRLFGREQELAELRRLLTNADVRLLTLTGVGGAGKSRLAHTVALEVAPRFDNIAALVDLATVHDPQLVPAAIAQAVGVQESGAKTVQEILTELLTNGPSLLVLDNFEQVLDAALFIANLLSACHGLVILLTTREPLAIRQEQVFPVEPLVLPKLDELHDVRTALLVPSVALFEERARARRPAFRLTDENVRAVGQICVRLDGLPLAIELAAAQAAVLPPTVILDRLSTRTPFPVSAPRDLPLRQQTLKAAISWSYELLDAGEQAIFRWCGVFAGGCTAEALDAVREGIEPRVDTLAPLAQLVTKSLVRVADPTSETPRYALLETLRAFALEQLETSGELVEARRRHAVYFVGFAEGLQPQLRGEGMAEALERLSSEYANFREVFQWSSEFDIEVGLRLAGALYRFWLVRGHLAEARQWLEPALARVDQVSTLVQAVALNAAGVLAGMQDDHARATEFFERSLAVWQAIGDPARMAFAHLNLGLVAHNLNDLSRAQVQFRAAEELFSQVGDKAGLGRAVGSLARLAREKGDFSQALVLFGRCLQLFREAHDEWGLANALHNLGHVKLALEQPADAEEFFRQALDVRLQLGNVLGIAECLEGFATAVVDRHPRRATQLMGAADALREQAGAPVATAEQDRYAAVLQRARLRQRQDAFDAAWAAGRSLSVDEAVTLAVRPPTPAIGEELLAAADQSVQRLTPREREITKLIALGRSNRDIAQTLVVTVRTVESHLERIYRKLGVQSRAELAVWAVHHGLTVAQWDRAE